MEAAVVVLYRLGLDLFCLEALAAAAVEVEEAVLYPLVLAPYNLEALVVGVEALYPQVLDPLNLSALEVGVEEADHSLLVLDPFNLEVLEVEVDLSLLAPSAHRHQDQDQPMTHLVGLPT